MTRRRLVLATANAHKVEEIRRMLADFPIEVATLADYPDVRPAAETGADFETNATLKAEAVAGATDCWALADDSGLEVDALDGRPGVHSKRYAGADATDADNNRRLLEELAPPTSESRAARFVSVMALARPGASTLTVRGEVRGTILDRPRGDGGFGYDPLFYYPPFEKSFGELTLEQKNRVSHRAAALAAMRERIGHLLNGEDRRETGPARPEAPAAGDPGHPATWTTPSRPGEHPAPGPGAEFLAREAESSRPEPIARHAHLLEYVEAIVVALIMALIMREFFFEAFKIPTPSMAPTLRGAPKLGDRILVDKFIYRVRDPRRWEVIVFRYPLNQSTNYIKRLIGLPGETVRIVDGDVWIDGRVARKPAWRQESIWIPLYPISRDPHGALDGEYRPPGRFELSEDQAVPARGWSAAPGPGQRARLRYAFDPLALGFAANGVSWRHRAPELEPGQSGLRDFRVDGTLRLDGPDADAAVVIDSRGFRYRVVLRAGGEGTEVELPRATGLQRSGRPPAVTRLLETGRGRPVPAGEAVPVSVRLYDQQLRVLVDGEAWFHYEFTPDPGRQTFSLAPSTITLELAGGGGTWSTPAVFRDIHYTQNGFERRVPADSYLVLGDNSTNSKDSRRWKKSIRPLVDGRLIEYEEDEDSIAPHPLRNPRPREIVDVYGNRHGEDEIDWRAEPRHVEAPFVERSLLIGRAFMVFFPWPPFYNRDFRPGLIR